MLGTRYSVGMKIKVTFKPLRNLSPRPVRIINKKARAVVKPTATPKPMIWRGRHIHSGSVASFWEQLHHRMTAPFHFALPVPKAGPA